MKTNSPSNSYFILFFIILLIAVACRSYKASELDTYPHDDVISYLVSAGHLGDYKKLTSAFAAEPTWVSNQVWLDLFQPHNKPILNSWKTIINDLQTYDIHPPIYFLWLNIVLRGVNELSPQAGWLSNVAIFIINGFLLIHLGHRLFNDRRISLAAFFIWALSSATIKTSILARHYELLTTLTLISSIIVLHSSQKKHLGWLHIASLSACTMLGFWANYQFLYVLPALGIILIVQHRNRPLQIILCGSLMVSALALALYLYPALFNQANNLQEWESSARSADSFTFRVRNSLEEPLKYCIFGSLLFFFTLAQKRVYLTKTPHVLYWFIILILTTNIIAYLAYLSPKHAMGERYLASLWPFLSLFFGMLLVAYWHNRAFRIVAILLICLPTLKYLYKPHKNIPLAVEITKNAPVIADFNKKGVWPVIALSLDASQPTLVAPQSSLLESEIWLESMPASSGKHFWISLARSKSAKSNQKVLMKRLQTGFEVIHMPDIEGELDVFIFGPKENKQL